MPPEVAKIKPISLSELDKTGPKTAKQPKISPKDLDIGELRKEIAASLAHDLVAKEAELEAELAASEPVE